MMSSAGEFDLRAGWVALLAVVLLVASAPARAQQANLWSHELPADKPVLIDSIGSRETTGWYKSARAGHSNGRPNPGY